MWWPSGLSISGDLDWLTVSVTLLRNYNTIHLSHRALLAFTKSITKYLPAPEVSPYSAILMIGLQRQLRDRRNTVHPSKDAQLTAHFACHASDTAQLQRDELLNYRLVFDDCTAEIRYSATYLAYITRLSLLFLLLCQIRRRTNSPLCRLRSVYIQ
jgi:hypothetical protein